MARQRVRFEYHTGLRRDAFDAAELTGSWDRQGRGSPDAWTTAPMRKTTDQDGCWRFTAEVELDPAGGVDYSWGVWLRARDGGTVWGIFAEVDDRDLTAQHRTFTLDQDAGAEARVEAYRLSQHERLGARPHLPAGVAAPAIRFAVWAPDARGVEVVFGGASGYIADDGHGAMPDLAPVPMEPAGAGLWQATLPGYERFAGRHYLYRVTRDDGQIGWSTDMYSLKQAGSGDFDPRGGHYDGTPDALDGTPSCSVVVDPSLVAPYPDRDGTPVPAEDFWADERTPDRPVPNRLEDLVIYELHVGALAPDRSAAGTFADALAFLPYLEDLGVNAVELMPMLEFNGTRSWGYGSSHFLAVESSAGGRDALKHFVRACHRRGIAVLMDMVFNHYNDDSARAAWQYSSLDPERNHYYWYQGRAADYQDPTGGYVDNESSGWAPRYHEEQVRLLFVSSAVMLLEEFHLDGFRLDQTTAIHLYNRLHRDGSPVGDANVAGRKFLRELCQTLKALRPEVMLVAEDHSGWLAVTQPAAGGGLGFDASWYVDFYHHLIGDKGEGPEYARLLHTAASQQSGPLAMGWFAGALTAAAGQKVVYHENHDEAGNAANSLRTIRVAAGGAPLVGATRRYAEARCRFACGMTMLSPGTPLFLMGEEVGAEKAYTYDRFNEAKEDLHALRAGSGANLFRFYQDVIAFRLANPAVRSHDVQVLHARDPERVIAFRRWAPGQDLLVIASLNNQPFDAPGYRIQHPALADAGWREVFNSDAARYGGDNVGNLGATLRAAGGTLEAVVPANGFVILERAL
jgi:1,4-alpha-glucan branching enzyme